MDHKPGQPGAQPLCQRRRLAILRSLVAHHLRKDINDIAVLHLP